MADLAGVGISMKEVTDKLTVDGVKQFADAFDELLETVENSTKKTNVPQVNSQNASLSADLDAAVKKNIEDWRATGKVRRLWQGDASLWTNEDESKWLGWLGITDEQLASIAKLKSFAEEIKSAGFSDILLLGMGGSSLCPEVLSLTYPQTAVFRVCISSTRPILQRFAASRKRLTSRRRSSLFQASRGAPSNPTSTNSISSSA